MRDPFDIYPETTPADALDALYTLTGESGAPRSVNGLTFTGEGMMFGRAVTMRSLPARQDHDQMVGTRSMEEHGVGVFTHALSLCDERSVLVIEARGTLHYAAGGGTGLSSLLGQRAAGLLTDGQIRDSNSLTANAARTGTKLMTGGFTLQYGSHRMLTPYEVNTPVAIDQTLVVPGDYVFGNADGVVVIPEDIAEEVLETAVVLARSAAVMEDMLIEKRGILGIDLKGITPEVIAGMKARFEFSNRQIELMEKNVTDVR
jgi:regulator of RNase E activity RraA